MNGGPGATSLNGLFLENGPLRVTRTGDGPEAFSLHAAEHSWADSYNVIFLDQPVNTGFSYGDSSLTDMQVGSDEFYSFLTQFYDKYPSLKTNPFLLTGESYAGKYVPLFAHDILERNKAAATFKIPLKAILIFDGLPSVVIQRTNMHIVPQALGLLDANNMNQISALEQRCRMDHATNMTKGESDCKDIMRYIRAVSGGVSSFDGRIFGYDWDAIKKPYIDMFSVSGKKEDLFKAIHIDKSLKDPKFEASSGEVAEGYRATNLEDYSRYYNYLIHENIPLIVMAGEFDMRDGVQSQYVWMKQLLEVSDNFWKEDRRIYFYKESRQIKGGDGVANVGAYWS